MISSDTRLARTAVVRVAASQILLALFVWGVLGAWSARRSWLLQAEQAEVLRLFFARDLPILGFFLVVALPALRIRHLARAGGAPLEKALVDRLLSYPRGVGALDLAASIALFVLAAARLALADAPPIESAEVAFFGLVSGVLFGILSYGLLQAAVRPLLLAAIARAEPSPMQPVFPLAQKLIIGCLALAFVVSGLFLQLALFRSEQSAEKSAGESVSEALGDLLEASSAVSPAGADGWRRFLASAGALRRGGTAFVLDGSGRLVASAPDPPPAFDRELLRDERWRRSLVRDAGRGAIPVRLSETRVVSLARDHGGGHVGVMMPPDPAAMRSLVRNVTPVVLEVFGIAVVLSATLGSGLARPLRDLDRQTREFAKDQSAPSPEIAPTDDEIGVLVHSTVAMREEIRRVQEQLREIERRAATAELLAGVAHEVRNPLFGITSAAAALEHVLSGDPKIAPHLGLIARESRRLTRMMEEMLVLQRVPNRKVGPLPAAAVVRAAAAAVRARHPEREIPIEIAVEDDVSLAEADRDRVESVFSNLFDNAAAASENVTIRCRIARGSGFAVIEVEDDGPGIPAEVRGRMFEPFVSSRPGGTGMGLALCRQIVAEHGGTIEVASEPGRTVFTVRLPAV